VRHDLTGDEPVEQHPHRGELLLHVRRRVGEAACLYIGGDIVRPDRGKRQTALVAPGEKSVARVGIGPAGVRVADVRGEEVDVAPGGLVAGVGDQRRDELAARQRRRDVAGSAGFDNRGKLVGGLDHGSMILKSVFRLAARRTSLPG
jgi:hypothetical protein